MTSIGHLIERNNANINLTPGPKGIVLQPYEPVENATDVWNRDDGTNLISDIRAALSKTLNMDACDGEDRDSCDWATADERLVLFADRINLKGKEIASNASMLLEELELHSSSTAAFSFYGPDDDSPMSSRFSVLDESNQSSHYNMSLTNRENWLQDTQADISIIESWEVEAEKLSRIAIAAFQNMKSDGSNVAEDAWREAISNLKTNAEGIFREMETARGEQRRSRTDENRRSLINNPILFHDETWEYGGFRTEEVVLPEIALETVKAMPMKTYKLRDDKRRDLGVSKDERRTRHHVGVLDPGDKGDGRVSPASIFSYNIGAVSHLATSLDLLVASSLSSYHLRLSLEEKIAKLTANARTQIQSGRDGTFRSPSQLAFEVAALETEAALTRIARLSQTVLQSARVNSMRSGFVSRARSLAEKDARSARENWVERDSASAREEYDESAGARLDRLIVHFETVDKMEAAWNSMRRELAEMDDAATIESRVAKEEIHAEAEVERENEATTLEQVRLVGKARVNEIVRSVENVFWHLAGCLQHITTPEGRQQFLFYVGTAAALVFAISTMKELIALGCLCLLRFFTAPRLVREYGNLSRQARKSAKNAQTVKEIVLPPKIKERMDIIVKVATAAGKRQFPLRSVLLHGKPGTGKSMVAKAIAQSTGLPYALMSGADAFPLGSQGPAELRRLLTWASSKRHGGILIIDEAETALGSRSKSTLENDGALSSSEFSRDCLNVLLSMTGSFGNIMLILTTNHPSELDEAVLDRMDELIHLPLPLEKERSTLLRDKFFRLFEPEEKNRSPLVWRLLSKIHRTKTKARFETSFDPEVCVLDLARDSKTNGFSGRELEKMIQGVLHKTFACDSGVLDRSSQESY